MKTNTQFLLMLISLFIFCNCLAQKESSLGQNETPELPIDSITKKITYQGIVLYVDSITNEQELFSRAREWVAKTYKSSKDVIQRRTRKAGKSSVRQ